MESLFALVVLFSLKGETFFILEKSFKSELECTQSLEELDEVDVPLGAENISFDCVPLSHYDENEKDRK